MMIFMDGGPAFPGERDGVPGMSLRDYFAGQALSGLLASCAGSDCGVYQEEQAATLAYGIADAMLEKRRDTSGNFYKMNGERR